MKPILYYAADCPDTAPFVAELKRLGVDYEAVEVLSSIPNLKQWLRLRDRHAAVRVYRRNLVFVHIPLSLVLCRDMQIQGMRQESYRDKLITDCSYIAP